MLEPQGHRPVGVKVPDGQLYDRSDKADLTVEHLLKMEFFAAQYVENGKLKSGLIVQSGGHFYLAPNGSTWLAGMRELSAKMTDNVKALYDQTTSGSIEDVPIEDTVDIIAQATAAGADPTQSPEAAPTDEVDIMGGSAGGVAPPV